MTRTSRSVIKFVCVPTLTRLFLLVAHTSQRLNETRRTRKVTEEEEIPKGTDPKVPVRQESRTRPYATILKRAMPQGIRM